MLDERGSCVGDKQPMPVSGTQNVTPVARISFADMLNAAEKRGVESYGTTLQTFNGRDVFQDLLEELVDAWQYCIQARMEHAALEKQYAEKTLLLRRWAIGFSGGKDAVVEEQLGCTQGTPEKFAVVGTTTWINLWAATEIEARMRASLILLITQLELAMPEIGNDQLALTLRTIARYLREETE